MQANISNVVTFTSNVKYRGLETATGIQPTFENVSQGHPTNKILFKFKTSG